MVELLGIWVFPALLANFGTEKCQLGWIWENFFANIAGVVLYPSLSPTLELVNVTFLVSWENC